MGEGVLDLVEAALACEIATLDDLLLVVHSTFLALMIRVLIIIFAFLLNVEQVIVDVIFMVLHLVEQLFDLVTVLALVSIVVEARVVVGVHLVNDPVDAVVVVVVGRVTLVCLAQLVDFPQSSGLLILLCVQTRVLIEIGYLLFCIDSHVFLLLERHQLVNLEHTVIIKAQLEVLEAKGSLHCH